MEQRVSEWVQVHQKIRGVPNPPLWGQIIRKYNMHMDVQVPGYGSVRVNRAACSQTSFKSVPT